MVNACEITTKLKVLLPLIAVDITHISISKLMLKQSQLCASSELTQIFNKLHTITAVESTIVVSITKLQITNINKIRILKVY